jgi:hypothetical protein
MPDDDDSLLTSTSGIYSVPNGTNPIVPNMVPGGGAFTLGQWGKMYQARANIAQDQGWSPDNDNRADAGYSLLTANTDGAGSGNDGGGDNSGGTQSAQLLPPSMILTEPPLELIPKAPIEGVPKPPTEIIPKTPAEPVKPVPPPLPEYPTDHTKPPGEGWEWKGRDGSTPGDGRGSWVNPKTGEKLYQDLNHKPPIGPHHDYFPEEESPIYPNRNGYRWYPDGRMEPKKSIDQTIEGEPDYV